MGTEAGGSRHSSGVPLALEWGQVCSGTLKHRDRDRLRPARTHALHWLHGTKSFFCSSLEHRPDKRRDASVIAIVHLDVINALAQAGEAGATTGD